MTALPTFLIIGAPKAGTTSLHRYLDAHPDVSMSTVKEPMCFADKDWERSLRRYADLFPTPTAIRGEASTAYSSYPWAPEVPERVAAAVPDARLVYVVRDPIPRTLSHYAQNVWDRMPVKPFDELMEDLEDPWNMPVWCSRYATQLDRWRAHFSDDRFLVIDERELRTDRAATVQRVLAFIGADPSFSSPTWFDEHNAARSHRSTRSGAGRVERRLATWPGLRMVLTREVAVPSLRADQRERLVALLQAEAARFQAMTDLSVEGWTL